MLFLNAVVLLLIGCEVYVLTDVSEDQEDIVEKRDLYPDTITSNEVLERAYQMASVVWTPICRVPLRNGIYYEPGKQVKGIPYSSVKEINTYLFQDVSYHTFMTAVNNPRSVLYTEDISQEPYHGLNCAPFYGGVCSSTIMYALGFSIPYYANQIKDLSCMHEIESQEIDSLKICDVIWKNGHVQMVFDLEYKADTLNRVSTFESLGKSAHITSYSKEQFRNMWISGGYVAYRYDNLKYSDHPPVFKEPQELAYNNDLCPSKGDRAVYRTDDEIVINIFNNDYDWIVLEKEGVVIDKEKLHGDDFLFQNLSAGIYFVYLQKDGKKTSSVSFETITTDVSVSSCTSNNLIVNFLSTGKADYVALSDLHGNSLYYPISDIERNMGELLFQREIFQNTIVR